MKPPSTIATIIWLNVVAFGSLLMGEVGAIISFLLWGGLAVWLVGSVFRRANR